MYVSPDLKKFAKQNGFMLMNGYVYGLLGGYFVTFVEGMDLKIVSIACDTTESDKITEIFTTQFMKGYRIRNYKVTPYGIKVSFSEYIPVMGKVKLFLQEFLNHLNVLNIKGDGFCTSCGKDIASPSNIILSDGFVRRVHSECIQKAFTYVEDKRELSNKEAKVFIGVLSTFLCAVLTYLCAFFVSGMFVEGFSDKFAEMSFISTFMSLSVINLVIMVIPPMVSRRSYGLLGSKFNKTAFVMVSFTYLLGVLIAGKLYFNLLNPDIGNYTKIIMVTTSISMLLPGIIDTFSAYKNQKLKVETLQLVLH